MMLPLGKTKPEMHDKERLSWMQLIRTENVGPITFHKFIDRYGSATKALEALPELEKRSGRKKPLKVPPIGLIEKEMRDIQRLGGKIVTAADDAYPQALAATEDAPPVLTVIGDLSLMQKPCIAIIGARNASMNGQKFARSLADGLGTRGQTIASGLARGIDTAAHHGSLNTGTIAVVAGGIDVVYPSENEGLYKDICEKGLVIAENPYGTAPRARDFPRRNRIVSGISQAVVVVEATERSGSLITARFAAEQGRDVYAVPGHPLDPRASGPNKLIRDGAVLVRNADDILEHIHDFSGAPKYHFEDSAVLSFHSEEDEDLLQDLDHDINDDPQTIDDIKAMLLSSLSHTPSNIDEIIRHHNLNIAQTQTALLEMELSGDIQRLPGNRIVKLDN